MTDIQRAQIRRLLEEQTEKAASDPEAARASLMRSGFYNNDGSLKPAFGRGGKKAA
jgi:hypothetical protein